MQLIGLALYAVTLLALFNGSPQSQLSFVFAAGTGHEGLDCAACHHVHAPLGVRGQWQQPMEAVPRFRFYEARVGMLDDSSLLCLSCHDGAVAPAVDMPEHATITSQVGRSVNTTGDGFRFPMGSHPVGVRYDPANPHLVREPGLQADIDIPLPDGRVQCVSCHDPHGTTGQADLLWVSNKRSGLCLTCHRL